MFDDYTVRDTLRQAASVGLARLFVAGMVAELFGESTTDPRFPGAQVVYMNSPDKAWNYYVKLMGLEEDEPDGSR